MPCWDQERDLERVKDPYQQNKIDNLTRMLCGLCRKIDNLHYIQEIPGLREWWIEHEKWDKKRKK